ncbi:MAG: cupin [Bdellovibrionales bacterium GWB1_55_8]|nr:MAG: cupin [Bdellovibrionales bacterium GWB1_55_8]
MEQKEIMKKAESVSLAGFVDYSSGSVVSKTLLKKDKGNVTLFSFDAGQGLSEHTAPFDAFVQILDGEAELIIGGRSVHVRTGEAAIMPENVPHAVKANQRFKMLLTMIRQ